MKFDYQIVFAITDYTAKDFINFLVDKNKIQKVLLFTEGGSGEASVAIKNYIETHKKKVQFYCIGKVESSGLIILAAGRNNVSYKDCMFMTHKPLVGNGKFLDQWKHKKKLKLYKNIMQLLTPNLLVKKKPTYLTANEALQHGLVSKII